MRMWLCLHSLAPDNVFAEAKERFFFSSFLFFIFFFKKKEKTNPLTLGLCLSFSDIEWSHLISISKGLQENQKNPHKPRNAALSLSMKHVEKEEKGEGREWQRVIRGAEEAKGGRQEKMKRFCVCDPKGVYLTKGVFSYKSQRGRGGNLTRGRISAGMRGGGREWGWGVVGFLLVFFFLCSHVESDRGILLVSLPCGPDSAVKKSGLIPALWEVSSGTNQPPLCDVGSFEHKYSGY